MAKRAKLEAINSFYSCIRIKQGRSGSSGAQLRNYYIYD